MDNLWYSTYYISLFLSAFKLYTLRTLYVHNGKRELQLILDSYKKLIMLYDDIQGRRKRIR